jgi:hypothetical protein
VHEGIEQLQEERKRLNREFTEEEHGEHREEKKDFGLRS